MTAAVREKTIEEQRLKVITHYLKAGIKSRADLHRLTEAWTGEIMPFNSVCDDHQTPWHYLSSLFFEDHRNLVVIANRDGGKTKTTAKLNALELVFKPGIEIASVGAIKRQAKKCYKYTKAYLSHPLFSKLVLKSIMELTEIANGSTYEQLVGTLAGVNSPHPQKLRADEVELMSRDVLEEMSMVPVSKDGIKASMVLISTRKFPYGNMQEYYESAKERNFEILVWCYKETAQGCPDSRSGKIKRIYEIPDIATFGRKKMQVQAYNNCLECVLLPTCRGDLKRARGWVDIDDLIDEYLRLDTHTWLSQKECRRPSTEGLYYPEFDDNLHIIKGMVNPPESWKRGVGFDFGDTHPTVALLVARDGNPDPDMEEFIVYKEYVKSGRLVADHVESVKAMLDFNYADDFFGDPAAAGYLREFNNNGLPIQRAYNDRRFGIQEIRKLLKVNPLTGRPRLRFSSNCRITISQMRSYHKKRYRGRISEDPEKIDDDCPDALRYFVASLMRLRKVKERPSGLDRPRGKVRGGSYAPPTSKGTHARAVQYAQRSERSRDSVFSRAK